MRNPFGKDYSGSARDKYLAKGSQAAQDAADQAEAARQLAAEKREARAATAKVNAAKGKVNKCARSKVKPGAMKCGAVGTGIYCNKHSKEGTIITNG